MEKTKLKKIRNYFQAKAFTLVELLVSVVLFLLAVTVALSATIGSNNLILRAESRSAVTESARAVSDFLRRNTVSATTNQVSVTNNVVTVKQFTSFQNTPANTCTEVGWAEITLDGNNQEIYNFNGSNKNVIAMKISQLDVLSSLCTEPVFYQGPLIDKEKVKATSFEASLPGNGCLPGQCALLRYSLSLTERGIAQSTISEGRRASLSIVTSLPIGVGQ